MLIEGMFAATLLTTPPVSTSPISYTKMMHDRDFVSVEQPTTVLQTCSASLPQDTSSVDILSSKQKLPWLEDVDTARAISLENAKARAFRLAIEIGENSQARDTRQAAKFATSIVEILDSLPKSVNVPKPVPLSGSISLFWEAGKTYAEFVVNPNGEVSAYGVNTAGEEFFLDSTIDDLRSENELFPRGLTNILV
jgi:hypothetical protein